MKRLLFLAYYFPPLGMGGVQRALKLVRYLPEFGWFPHVVTVKDIRYYARDESLLEEVSNIPITRTDSFDPARLAHLFLPKFSEMHRSSALKNSFGPGRWSEFLTFLLYPDTKLLWLPFARKEINRLKRIHSYDAVFSTSPPVSAHMLAAKLNLPWIADFRDYWTLGDGVYAPTIWHRHRHHTILRKICQKASAVLAVSDPIAESIRTLCSSEEAKKINLLPNGFDPADFEGVEPEKLPGFSIVYTGNLNSKRSPRSFFMAVAKLVEESPELRNKIRCFFVGKHFAEFYNAIQHSIRSLVTFVGYVPHKKSLTYVKGASALLLLLSRENAPGVVTGKVFEYLGSRKPILALVPKHCAAYELLRHYPYSYMADPDNIGDIVVQMKKLLTDWGEQGSQPALAPRDVEWLNRFSRRQQAQKVAELLDKITVKKV